MPWYVPWSETLKKKVCRYLLQRYLGQFLEEKLTLEQLTVDFYKGTGTISNVTLYSQALNDVCECQGWCIEVIGGSIGSIKVNVPWNALMSEDSSIEVTNLFINIKPLARQKDGTSMLESMWSSMSSSMQLAQDCLEKEGGGLSAAKKMEGLECFAQTIDNVLNRIKARLIDTEIRLEYLTRDNDRGIALIIKIRNLEYKNEAGGDPPDKPATSDNYSEIGGDDQQQHQKEFSISTYTTHHITMEGITFYTEEFRIDNHETIMDNIAERMENTAEKIFTESCVTMVSEQFYSTISELPETEQQMKSCYEQDKLQTTSQQELDTDHDRLDTSDTEDDQQLPIVFHSEPIMFGEVKGQQEIRIKMKQTENVPGPKVQLELNIGALHFFLSPRQFHLLSFVLDFFLNSAATVPIHQHNLQCDDEECDIRRTNSEDELRTKVDRMTQNAGGLGLNYGWSPDHTDTSPSHVITNQPTLSRQHAPPSTLPHHRRYSESVFSSNSSMTSSMCSSMTQSTHNTSRARKRGIIDADPNADISSLNIRIASCAIVLLHDDILVESATASTSNNLPLNEDSVQKMKRISDEYFEHCTEMGVNEILRGGDLLNKSCDSHHLRLLLAPIIVEGEEQRNASGNLLRLSVSIARGDFREVLKDTSVPLIEFLRKNDTGLLPSRSEISLGIRQTTHSVRGYGGKRLAAPKTEINISLAPCLTEIDISISDRLNSLFNSQPFYLSTTSQLSSPSDSSKSDDSKLNVNLTTDLINIRLRFPITDLRAAHDPERVPWWKRNVRSDYLLIKLLQTKMSYNPYHRYEIEANEINLFYCECENSEKTSLAKAGQYEKPGGSSAGIEINIPKISIELPAIETLHEAKTADAAASHNRSSDDSDGCPSMDYIGLPKSREYSPFSSKRVCRESDTPHSKQQSSDATGNVGGGSANGGNSDSENIKIPGDKEEMDRFADDAARYSKIQIRVFLPLVSLQLKSKHLYEVLYNRINCDLLLWQPNAPRPQPAVVPIASKIANSLLNIGMNDSIYAPFTMCKSGINYESSSATNSESEGESEIIYYSVYDRNKSSKMTANTTIQDNTSAISFQLNIKTGMFTIYAPVRDTQNHVIPGQLGEFVIKINSAVMFSVNGYRGNEDLGYFCLQAASAELYHYGLIPVPSANPPLRFIGCVLPAHMQSTFYPSPKNIAPIENRADPKRDQISLAVQIKSCSDQRIKRIKVAAGIQKTTLRHNTSLPEHSWLTQLIDMFDVLDYPVHGYTPLSVVTEVHLHLWDCAIDYRPRYLPYRAIVTVGTFMMSSNISTASSGCTLRFVAEDSTMCLAPQKLPTAVELKSKYDNKITVLPASELVCVIDLDLFEISLRLSEKPSTAFPKLDLRASINGAHLRTCSDSASALAQLLAYIATAGDLTKPDEDDLHEEPEKTPQELGMELLPVKQPVREIPTVSEFQQKRVNSLMEEAMKESVYIVRQQHEQRLRQQQEGDTDSLESTLTTEPDDMFCFPDETIPQAGAAAANRSGDSTPTLGRHGGSNKSLTESMSSTSTAADRQNASAQDDNNSNDSVSINTELQDLLDFETSIMSIKPAIIEYDAIETNPQVASELGNFHVPKASPKIDANRRVSSDTDDEFCFISHEERPKYNFDDIEPTTTTEPLRIVDNHFSVPIGKPDLLKAPKGFPMAVMRYTLCEMTLTWHIYGGNDFPRINTDDDNAPPADKDVTKKYSPSSSVRSKTLTHKTSSSSSLRTPMSDAYQMGVSYSKGSPNNITFNTSGSGSGSHRKRTWRECGGINRKHDILIEIQITKARFSHETYPQTVEQVSRQVLLIGELEIRDRLAVSNIKKFLYLPHTERRGTQNMVVIKTLHLRPDSKLKTQQECCLRISLLPLRLNIDQDALLFLVEFFNAIGSNAAGSTDTVAGNTTETKKLSRSRSHSTPPAHQPPIMMVDIPEAAQELHARKMVEENLMILMEGEDLVIDSQEIGADVDDNQPIFFSNIVFSPAVLISLDYHGKKIELSHGPLAGLLMGLGQLQCSQILLKPLCHRNGILGIDRLVNYFFREWLQDIKSHQLSSVLKGVGAMNTFVQLFQGIKDLFLLPIEQYQKDGRIVRGLQLGAQSFTARTALALLEITTRVIYLLQITAETAYDMVSPGPSVRRIRGNRRGKRKRLNPPQDIREGVSNAFHIVKEGVGDTAHTICEMTALEHDQKGYTGAVGAVIRQIPPTVVKPLVLATQATTNVLGGVRNQLVPDARIEAKEKWKDDDD